MEIISIIIILLLAYLFYELRSIRKEIKEIRESMLTKNSFESPLETYEKVTGKEN